MNLNTIITRVIGFAVVGVVAQTAYKAFVAAWKAKV